MKSLVFITALGVALIAAAPAEAAKKKKTKKVSTQRAIALQQQPTSVSRDPYIVTLAGDDEILGRDPDPFIRLMIRKEGRIRDQSGR